ncbi:AAA family ATPase [Mycoplasma phocoeninasale]|uniref:AAA family ATPase n=1 Tax=Mycoplasma phocoeninasale TaxID=2726117 RepID=A0A858U2F7_9MOLU|nr:AAA family ATPase [Mycoplasma phocoeninasale]MBN0970661.1 AAA family ATPase [Mycoplasma phocoeninasale]QJG66229.1 AAA family ATPase [Mycoplasma phocoeninasale]
MKRLFKIKKFRNIGIKDEQEIILNNFRDKNDIGNLVIIVGPNNSGKSNILDALYEWKSNNFLEEDINNFAYEEKDKNIEVELEIKNNNQKISYKTTNSNNQKKIEIEGIEIDKVETEKIICELKDLKKKLDRKNIKLDNIDLNEIIKFFEGYKNELVDSKLLTSKKNIENFVNYLVKINNYREDYYYYSEVSSELKKIVNSFTEKSNIFRLYKFDKFKKINQYSTTNFGFPIDFNIIKYEFKEIDQNQFTTEENSIQNNNLFKSIFKIIDFDIKKINTEYKRFKDWRNVSILRSIESEISEKIKEISKRFNQLYFSYNENDEYNFTIRFESRQILFGLERGKSRQPINLSQQSTGFKWFFNFYFNFLASNSLNAGDVILLDEPATNLHVEGQKELRKFLKEFARKNGVTFVISTHSPFLIDIDNLEELRIVKTKNDEINIDNLFTLVNINDPNSLLPIKKSLTIGQNILYEYETKVIWVEGITDYIYLTMFKEMLKKKNIAFLPFNGVGNDEKKRKIIAEKIVKTYFPKVSILVDGDANGNEMKRICEESNLIQVKSISDLNDNNNQFKEIEDLFSDTEVKNFKLKEKSSENVIIMKQNAKLSDFSENTIKNFEKLFDLLLK